VQLRPAADLCHGNETIIDRLVDAVKKIDVASILISRAFHGPGHSDAAADSLLSFAGADAERGAESIFGRCARSVQGIADSVDRPWTHQTNREDEKYSGHFCKTIRVDTFDAAIAEANRTRNGLAAGLLSDDADHYRAFCKRIRAGVVIGIARSRARVDISPLAASALRQQSSQRLFASDYCSYPVASIESERVSLPEKLPPGIML